MILITRQRQSDPMAQGARLITMLISAMSIMYAIVSVLVLLRFAFAILQKLVDIVTMQY